MIQNVFTRRLRVLSFATAAICATAMLIAGSARAGDSLLWYDGFVIDDANAGSTESYVSTQSHHLQDGGSGTFFTGSWLQSDFNAAIGNMQSEMNFGTEEEPDVQAHPDTWSLPGSLTRVGQNLPSTGDKASDIGIGFGGDECCYTSRTGRQFAQNLNTMDGTIYMGFLVNYGNGNPTDPHYRSVEFWDNGVNDDQLNMSIGFSSFGNYDNPVNGPAGANQQLSVRIDGVREEFGTDVQTNHQLEEHLEFADQVGQTHSIVIKFDLTTSEIGLGGTGDTVSFFLNPTLTDVVEPTPSLVVSGVDLNLDRMSSIILFHFTGNQTPNVGAFDELRVATTWGEAAILSAIPEPATSLMLAMGALGLVLSARRKRS